MRTKNRYFTLSLLGTALFATVCSAGAILGVAAEEVAGGDTTGTDVQTENFVTSQEGWDALPAGWAFGDGVITSTSNAFLGGGIMRDYYADTPSDYTVSATLHNTATDNGAEIGLGIIPWAQDASNYVIVSVKWNANSATPFSVLTQRFVNGVQYGAEGSSSGAWNEDVLTGTPLATLDRHEPVTVTVEKRYNGVSNMDAYTTTVSGTLTDGTTAELTLATDEFSMSVGFGGKIGLYSFNTTTEVTSFTAEYTGAVEYDYEAYSWYTRGSYNISSPSLYSVSFANDDADITMQARQDGITRFWVPSSARDALEDITVSADIRLSAQGIYGFYLQYNSDSDHVRLEVNAEGIELIAVQNNEEQTWTYAVSLMLTDEHALSATVADGIVSVILDGAPVSFVPGEGEAVSSVPVAQLAGLDELNVGLFATGDTTLTATGFAVAGTFRSGDIREQDGWSVMGSRPNTWTVEAQENNADISNIMTGGTGIWSTLAWTKTTRSPADGYIVSAQVQVTEKAEGEIKYGIMPYYNNGDVIYVWISKWPDGGAMLCLFGTINGVNVFSGNGFMETPITIDMEAVNTLEVEILSDGSLNVYLNKAISPTVATKIDGLAEKPAANYGLSVQNVCANFTDIQVSAERIFTVENEVILNLPSNFPTTGVVGQRINLGVITASLAGDGIGTVPTPVIVVTDPDGEQVELDGVRFTPEKAGTYTVTITATDSWGSNAKEVKTIVVTEEGDSSGGGQDVGGEQNNAPEQGLPGWAIAVIVVGVVVVAAAVVTGILVLRKKAGEKSGEDSDAKS